ncbi:MAG: hypothetical protein HUJ65_04750, partial [Oscillospiraceae bacterium]|nr:hypothetical protein [Oscillospiraceae bacterium]
MLTIRIADVVFGVNLIHSYTAELCRAYITDADAEELITITQEDIEFER